MLQPRRTHCHLERLVADAGLLLPATMVVGLGLRELFDTHIDPREASGRAGVGDKAMTLIHSALGRPHDHAGPAIHNPSRLFLGSRQRPGADD